MNVRKSIAGIALSTAVLLGGAGAAMADTPAPGPTHLTPAQCKEAAHVLHELKIVDARLKADYAKLVHVRDAQAAAGHTKVVKVLDAKLAHMRAVHAKAVARVKAIVVKVKAACAPAAAG